MLTFANLRLTFVSSSNSHTVYLHVDGCERDIEGVIIAEVVPGAHPGPRELAAGQGEAGQAAQHHQHRARGQHAGHSHQGVTSDITSLHQRLRTWWLLLSEVTLCWSLCGGWTVTGVWPLLYSHAVSAPSSGLHLSRH